jgi:hypothetical protein
MLTFPYQPEPLAGPPSPSLPPGVTEHWRPLIPITAVGPTGRVFHFGRAVLDSGADDCVLPQSTLAGIGAVLRPDTGHRVRWRGQVYPLRFGDLDFVLTDQGAVWRWPTVVAFSPAPLRYPILGRGGCLRCFDVRFHGEDLRVELETNRSFPGTIS